MTSKPVVLVLGAGANVGKALASKFAGAGYAVALAARSIADGPTPEGHIGIKADLSNPNAVPSIFAKVKETLGTPSTVVYNAAANTAPPVAENIFSIPVESIQKDINILSTSAFVAAREAVAGFESLPKETKKTFILTGNITNRKVLPVPMIVTLGIGKSAAAYWIGVASSTFKDQNYRFYYGDQRTAEGGPIYGGINGPAHAEEYFKLATEDTVQPWDYTFVAGKGYVDFSKD